AVRLAMESSTLHEWAARQPGARAMQGRTVAWATTFPNGTEVVIRHSRHGGLLAPLTGDLFRAPTRAPLELAAALRLAGAGVPTPEVLAYAVYPAFGPFARADVATRRLHGRALPEAWHATATDDERWALIDVLSRLLGALRRAGAHHPDLNVRNVLVLDAAPGPTAAILDVDRMMFGTPDDAGLAARNVRRLLRSMAKERVGLGVDLTSRQVQRLNETAGAGA
ncbi:MAG: lipopolysaccharide kinase InaA family protein, partial [Gemmatimonadales bacterium]